MQLRKTNMSRVLVSALGMATLAACGGGGDGGGGAGVGSTPPPVLQFADPTATAEDLANASASQLGVVFKTESNEVVLKWVDAFAAETAYRVERQTDGSTWQLQESLAASANTGAPYTWQRVIDSSATYRVVAERGGYVVPLRTQGGQSSVPVELMTSPPELVVDQQEPVRGSVQVSVEGAATAQSVQYFADLSSIGTSNIGPSFGVSWDSRPVADGNHQLQANVSYGSGLTVELQRSIAVDNPNVAVVFYYILGVDQIELTANASSDAGVASVEFQVNGNSIIVLNAPNQNTHWTHTFDTRGLPTGPATFKAIATDNNGDQAESSQQVNITHAPVVSMVSPTDGAIFRGALDVRATVTDDQPGTTVTAWLGDVQIFETTDSSIDRSHSLANVPPGQYTLRLRARDAGGIITTIERAVIVTAVTAFSYEYAGDSSLPITLLDTEGSELLYRGPVGPVHRRSVGGSDASLLNSADITNPSGSPLLPSLWQVSGGYVSTTGWIGSGTPSVFLWDPSGAYSALPYTLQAGEFREFLRSALHGSWLVWGSGRIYLRNLSAPSADIGPIQGDMLRGHAFANTAGSEKLYFARTTGQVGSSGILDLFVYDVAAGTTTLLTGGDAVHARPQTDATRVAWEKRGLLANINQPPFELVVAPVSNPTATVVHSTTATKYVLDDGILAWTETASNAIALKVDDGSSQTTVSHTTSTVLYSTSDGSVVFSESGKLYIWSAAQGRRLLLEVLPKELVQDDHDIYLTVGGQGVTIHRTTH